MRARCREELPRRHHAARAASLVLVAAVAASCAGSADAIRIDSPATGGPTGTSLVIGTDTTPSSTATTTGSAPDPPSTLAPRAEYVPTEGVRRLVVAGVPELAARAHLNAAVRAPEALPGCKMAPEVLAAVGAGESRHGTVGQFDEDGTSREVIKGYAFTGDDTDGGELDGDKEKDWAVGPMQFIPSTWRDLGRDGNDDGHVDPSNFYDAALATAAYLCHLAGPFPEGSFIEGQWQQWDRQKAALEQRTTVLHAQWEKQKQQRDELEAYVDEHPDDTTNAAVLARMKPLGPEPVYEEPPRPAGPSQLRTAIERYYGPEGDVRDDYRDDVEAAFRRLVNATGGIPVSPQDRLA